MIVMLSVIYKTLTILAAVVSFARVSKSLNRPVLLRTSTALTRGILCRVPANAGGVLRHGRPLPESAGRPILAYWWRSIGERSSRLQKPEQIPGRDRMLSPDRGGIFALKRINLFTASEGSLA